MNTNFILTALCRRVLAVRAKGKHSTADLASLQEKHNTLVHRIETWRAIQTAYMPSVSSLVEDASGSDDSPALKAEDIKLYLPSMVPPHLRTGSSLSSLLQKEIQLRIAQADDALADICWLRRVMAGILQFKTLNVSGSGQKPNTHIRMLYEKFQGKVRLAVARYRTAYAVLRDANPVGEWTVRLKELQDEDVRGPGRDDDEGILGEGNRNMSWIWLVRQSSGDGDVSQDFNDSIRVEWSKMRA